MKEIDGRTEKEYNVVNPFLKIYAPMFFVIEEWYFL